MKFAEQVRKGLNIQSTYDLLKYVIISNNFQQKYLEARESIKQYYRQKYQRNSKLCSVESDLLLYLEKELVPKCQKKLLQKKIQRIFSQRIKDELEKSSSVNKFLEISDAYREVLSKVKTRINLTETDEGAGRCCESLKDAARDVAEDIESFFDHQAQYPNVAPLQTSVKKFLSKSPYSSLLF